MSWKEYQESLKKPLHRSRRVGRLYAWGALALGLAAFAGFSTLLMQWDHGVDTPQIETKGDDTKVSEAMARSWKKLIAQTLQTKDFESGARTVSLTIEGKKTTALLSLDSQLQRFVMKQLKRNRVDWGAVAVTDAETGAVLALGSYSEKEPARSDLVLRATFPAASVFKMVTSVAAFEESRLSRNSSIQFSGRSSRIHRRDLTHESGPEEMTVAEAFAKSANSVFGKIGAQRLQMGALLGYAERFGFNQEIPFDLNIDTSTVNVPVDGLMETARVAAGFEGATLSPLHGALMASAAVNDGRIMQPFLVKRLFDDADLPIYEASPSVWRNAMQPRTAAELRQMMIRTITEGTAQKGFRKLYKSRVLGQLDIGGKTGSLTGEEPKGWNEWFVGYASSAEQKIAIGVVLVSEKQWRIRPSELAREVFDFYFSPRPVLEANAVRDLHYGP